MLLLIHHRKLTWNLTRPRGEGRNIYKAPIYVGSIVSFETVDTYRIHYWDTEFTFNDAHSEHWFCWSLAFSIWIWCLVKGQERKCSLRKNDGWKTAFSIPDGFLVEATVLWKTGWLIFIQFRMIHFWEIHSSSLIFGLSVSVLRFGLSCASIPNESVCDISDLPCVYLQHTTTVCTCRYHNYTTSTYDMSCISKNRFHHNHKIHPYGYI